jgi:hypothetical protein
MTNRALISIIASVLILVASAFWFWFDPFVSVGPGMTAPNDPVQENLNENGMMMVDDFFLTPMATFQIEARVLSTQRYRSGRESDLSPLDLTLGWGPMSDETNLEKIDIRQSARFYFWKTDRFPIPRKDIETHSANMHMIPSNDRVESLLKQIKPGETVTITGKLVNVEAADGWRWRTSLTRNDTGNGACEIVYVEKVEIIDI